MGNSRPMSAPFAVIQADGEWLCYARPVRVLSALEPAQVLAVVREAEEAVETHGLHAVGFISYEAAPGFDPALRVRRGSPTPLVWFGLFASPLGSNDFSRCSGAAEAATTKFELGAWRAGMGEDQHAAAVAQIKAHIAHGNTYQVNFTFPLTATFRGDPWALFSRLVQAQRSAYAAYVDTGRFAICSASPELFFHLADGVLTSRPMKGTAPRGRTLAEDEAQAAWLRASEKNRAENVMIVDMIRNDMGRVAEWGSVAALSLFDVERYPTLWQMTSTVTARTRGSGVEILQALFPCASITGAPKVRTMQIIADLEPSPRGVYTGAIGFMAPGGRAQFNVAIRTVVVDRQVGQAVYGVGSGIVWDSDANQEYAECLLKARVLAAQPADFALLETLRWTPEEGYFLLDRHLQRLHDSAIYFSIPVDLARARQALTESVATAEQPLRVRLLVDQSGRCRVETAPLPAPSAQPVRLGLARTPVNSRDIFLHHKTTRREVYEAAQRSRPDCDDVLLWNERGELTESCLANVALELNGQLATPPLGCGLLAGTLRGWLLDQGHLIERVVTLADLDRCNAIYVLNSLRGWRKADLVA